MAEPLSLQQILSMGSQVEKVQQVQQQQHDVSARQIAQDTRTQLDEKKIEVPAQERGDETKPTDDHTRQKSKQEQRSKQHKKNNQLKIQAKKTVDENEHGRNINIVV